jgi:hypothetical protein
VFLLTPAIRASGVGPEPLCHTAPQGPKIGDMKLAPQETTMGDLAKYIFFKPINHGYVYSSPNVWLIGSNQNYIVDEAQKEEIRRTINSMSARLLWIPIVGSLTFSAVLVTSVFLWANRFNLHAFREVLALIAILFSIYLGLLISRQILLRRLRPILIGLPTTNERATIAEIREALPKATLSPARRRVLRVCLIIMPIAMLGLLVSRAADMHDATHRPIIEALYLANANALGLVILFNLVWCGIVLVRGKAWYMEG